MGKDLKAENLTISLPNNGCNKNCPYCISKMTGYVENNYERMIENAEKVKSVARAAEVTSILFTGKGEPLLSLEELECFCKIFRDFPLEIQTNGISLCNNPSLLHKLDGFGINVVAISIDGLSQLGKFDEVFRMINYVGMISRVTLNLTNKVMEKMPEPIDDLIAVCKALGIRHLTFRRVIAPERPQDIKVAKWVEQNTPTSREFLRFSDKLSGLLAGKGKLIRSLNSGVTIWDMEGVSVSRSDYCIQERDCGGDLRSLVFLEDGHLYTSWNSRASVLF